MVHEIYEWVKERAHKKMLYIENCVIKSRGAARENRRMKPVHVKVVRSLKKKRGDNLTTNLFHILPIEESQIRIIVFQARMS